MYIAIAIIVFLFLILIHEAGHFAAAKLLGVKVNEFSVGMGPKLLQKQKGETKYSIRAIPFGGYCAMEGEDEATDDPRSFQNKPFWRKLIILVAGSFMNFLTGFIIILVIFSSAAAFTTPVLTGFMEGFPNTADKYLQAGDRVYSVDGHRVLLAGDISMFAARSDGTPDIVVIRDGQKVELKDFPMTLREYEIDGQKSQKYGFYIGTVKATIGEKLKNTWSTSLSFVRNVWLGLGDLFSGRSGIKDLSGPVGIVGLINEAGEASASRREALENVFYLCAFIAINLSVMNMLPIPALDGGRIFLMIVTLIVESITKKKLDPKYEGYINAGALVLLLGLMAFVMFNDIWKLVH